MTQRQDESNEGSLETCFLKVNRLYLSPAVIPQLSLLLSQHLWCRLVGSLTQDIKHATSHPWPRAVFNHLGAKACFRKQNLNPDLSWTQLCLSLRKSIQLLTLFQHRAALSCKNSTLLKETANRAWNYDKTEPLYRRESCKFTSSPLDGIISPNRATWYNSHKYWWNNQGHSDILTSLSQLLGGLTPSQACLTV